MAVSSAITIRDLRETGPWVGSVQRTIKYNPGLLRILISLKKNIQTVKTILCKIYMLRLTFNPGLELTGF